MIQFWRLTEGGEDNFGPAITADGLVIGRTPLIERRDERFVVRERCEIERLLRRAYQNGLSADRLTRGLASVAAALNANDPCLARIAAVHLRIPDLPNKAARDGLEAEDILIKCGDAEPNSHLSKIHKASPDDPKHPGWPAGTPGGRGGKFRPKDGGDTEIAQRAKVRRAVARGALRLGMRAILRLGAEAVANLIPILDAVADAAIALDIANVISEYWKLATDAAAAALDFVNKGPHNFEDLKVLSSGYEEFSSYGDFVKYELILDVIAKRFGGAGDGYQYHHIITQGGANRENIPAEQLQNTDNVIRLPTLLHEAVNAEYSELVQKNPNISLYQWVQKQPYGVQREVGLQILRELHILK